MVNSYVVFCKSKYNLMPGKPKKIKIIKVSVKLYFAESLSRQKRHKLVNPHTGIL